MRRTHQEFKDELLNRQQKYEKRKRTQQTRLLTAAFCACLILGVASIGLPMTASKGESAPMDMMVEDAMSVENQAPPEAMEVPMAPEVPGSVSYGSDAKPGEGLAPERTIVVEDTVYYETGDLVQELQDDYIDGTDLITGWVYRFGDTPGTLYVCIDGIWYVFAAQVSIMP